MASYRTSGVTFNTTSGSKDVVLTTQAGDLALAVVANTGNVGTPTVQDNATGGASTSWSLVTSALKATSADRMLVYVRNNLVGNGASTTFGMAPGTTTGGGMAVILVSGMARMGANAIRSSGSSANNAAATATCPLSNTALTGNFCLGAVFNATNAAGMTIPSGWDVERHDVGYATPTTGLEVATRDSGFTSNQVTWGSASASAWCAVAIELDTTIPDLPVIPLLPPMRAA